MAGLDRWAGLGVFARLISTLTSEIEPSLMGREAGTALQLDDSYSGAISAGLRSIETPVRGM